MKPYLSFFYDGLFEAQDEIPDTHAKEDVKKALDLFMLMYDPQDDNTQWFDAIKRIADEIGYASDMKAYKQNPDQYKGNVADVSMFLRIAVTGKMNSPDLYEVMHIIGYERTIDRIHKAIMKYV